MTLFQTIALLLTASALFSYVNYRYLRLPQTIGLMAMGLAASLTLVIVGHFVPAVYAAAGRFLDSIDFDQALLHGMLAFLLFAAALHLDLHDLREHKVVILTLATFGVLVSTALVGGGMYYALAWLGTPLPLAHCFLFGALISPTDPIAVLSIMRSLRAPKPLEIQIAGESLFNDGVGVVVFLAILGFAGLGGHAAPAPGAAAGAGHVAVLFLREAVGGAAYGMAIGLFAYALLKRVDDYPVEVLISLALVAGGYALAELIHVSGPIAMVVAGLFIGNHGRAFAMSPNTREHLDAFWELIDQILNAVLFVLIGLEVLVLRWDARALLAGAVAVVVVLWARIVSVAFPVLALRRFDAIRRRAVRLLTWAGLRGGISVALALSLRGPRGAPPDPGVDLILQMTYVVVVFSIGVQGLTIGPVMRWTLGGDAKERSATEDTKNTE